MTSMTPELTPAARLAGAQPLQFPNESAEYRAQRTALLAEEIELRRHIERVAALPPGGVVRGDYRFEGEDGVTDFAGLFRGHPTLVAYSYMFGPQRERPCPMCTNLLGAWEGNAADIDQHASLVVIARSPIERLLAWKQTRGWRNLRLYSDLNGAYSRDYFAVSSEGEDIPALLAPRLDPALRCSSQLCARRRSRGTFHPVRASQRSDLPRSDEPNGVSDPLHALHVPPARR